jgi:hypothetical protein
MLVYGDRAREACVAVVLEEIAASLQQAKAAYGVARRDLLTRAFVDGAELVQGLIDAEFEVRGGDDLTPLHEAGMGLATALASGLASGRAAGDDELAALAAIAGPATVKVKTAEGYAFYAVYPQAYLRAAAAHPWPEPPLVIGLRSIGTGLAAAVAVGAAAKTVISLRPVGDPFAREVRVSTALRARLAAHGGPFAIVDEGPGLSGSSFGCVADLLEALGVGRERIVFFPSHANDLGPQASPAHRERWRAARRPVRTLDDLLRDEPLAGWFGDLIGEVGQVEDLSAGAWRGEIEGPPENLPPVLPARERRKFRLTTSRGRFVARFAGLGAVGEGKWRHAQALAAAGFAPQPLALRRGFLLERWEEGERLAPGRPPVGFLERLGAYLGFRARTFLAEAEDGADLAALRRMAEANIPELLGEPAGGELVRRLQAQVPQAATRRRVHVDGKLQAWEWRARPDGSFCKLDALDHAQAHDLIGCQDIGWDIAGAAVEFGLDADEVEQLRAAVSSSAGEAVDAAALPFFQLCYAAFHGGLWAMADGSGAAPERRQRRFYQRWLEAATA